MQALLLLLTIMIARSQQPVNKAGAVVRLDFTARPLLDKTQKLLPCKCIFGQSPVPAAASTGKNRKGTAKIGFKSLAVSLRWKLGSSAFVVCCLRPVHLLCSVLFPVLAL